MDCGSFLHFADRASGERTSVIVSNMSSSGKLVIITGAARRIGACIARRAAAEGCNVLITANANAALADELTKQLMQDYGVKAGYVTGDLVEDLQGVCDRLLAHELVQENGGVDGLVHNASVYRSVDFDGENKEKALKELQQVTAIHFTAPYVLTQELLPQLKAKQGSVVAITDTSFGRAWKDMEHYTATKAALRQLVTNWAGGSLAEHGIRANCVAPGYILEAEEVDEDHDALLRKIPLGRIGKPEDVADAVYYFLQSNYTTGQTLAIDGGLAISS